MKILKFSIFISAVTGILVAILGVASLLYGIFLMSDMEVMKYFAFTILCRFLYEVLFTIFKFGIQLDAPPPEFVAPVEV